MNKVKPHSNKAFVFLGVFMLFVFLATALLSLSNFNLFSTTNDTGSTDPATVDYEAGEERADPEKGGDRASLEGQLPYRGNNFSIMLNEKRGNFDVYINPNEKAAGMAEFEVFLQQNNLTTEDMEGYYEITNSPF